MRTYGQFCGLAQAVELVGERWALLVVRDLVLGPKRFTDLRRGLPRIPTNVLSARLKELEQGGIIRRRVLPRPAASVVYELTEYGRELDEIVLRLSRWGAESLGDPRPGDIQTTDSLILALRSTFRPASARGLRADFELHIGEVVVNARVEDGTLKAAEGPSGKPDLVIRASRPLRPLMAGEIGPDDAVNNGAVRLTGDPCLLARFVEVFHIPRKPGSGRA
jgi:DNA-binding HxlR family transcriptional regulator/putative sterol carrier protein